MTAALTREIIFFIERSFLENSVITLLLSRHGCLRRNKAALEFAHIHKVDGDEQHIGKDPCHRACHNGSHIAEGGNKAEADQRTAASSLTPAIMGMRLYPMPWRELRRIKRTPSTG